MVTLMAMPVFAQNEWTVINNPDGLMSDLHSITETPNGTVHAVGNEGTYLINSGSGFVLQVHPANNNANCRKILFYNDDTGYILAGAAIEKTTDGGGNWTIIYTGVNNLQDLYFWDADNGIAVGNEGLILKTTDGGDTWVQTGSEVTTHNITGVIWITENIILAIAGNNTLLTSVNAGDTWISEELPYTTLFTDIKSNGEYVVITGYGSIILKSIDNGNSWIQSNFPLSTTNITSIALSSNGYSSVATSQVGDIFLSTNACIDWEIMDNTTTSIQLNSVQTTSIGSGWIVGSDGIILHNPAVPLSIELIDIQIPDGYALKQNYPNPFNPTTIIEYSIPISGIVTFTVYNTLGQIVNNIVNEWQHAGTYRINWTGSGLPSGVYFYQIHSESFTKTMKMVLVK